MAFSFSKISPVGGIPNGGSGPIPVKTANYTLAVGDRMILVDATLSNISIFAPAPSSTIGVVYTIIKIDGTANLITIIPLSGLIGGAATKVILPNVRGQALDFVSNGTGYDIK